jgi:flagellar hook-length control protein FliK
VSGNAATAAAALSQPIPSAKPVIVAEGDGGAGVAGVATGLAAGDPGIAASARSLSRAAVAVAVQGTSTLSIVGDTGKHSHDANGASTSPGGSSDATAVMSALGSSAVTGSSDAAPPPMLRVHAAVDSSDFPQGVSDRVSWMIDSNLSGAKMQVNPPQLGPIEVRISIQGDHAQVWMSAHSAVTRDALEASSPKLREMLGAQGFGQVSVDISQRSFQERPTHAQPYERTPSSDRNSMPAPVSAIAGPMPRSAPGALDAYA